MQNNTGTVLVFTDGTTRRIARSKCVLTTFISRFFTEPEMDHASWYISYEVVVMKGFMTNPSKTAFVPLTGWMYYDSIIKDFHKDPSVKIKFGELR